MGKTLRLEAIDRLNWYSRYIERDQPDDAIRTVDSVMELIQQEANRQKLALLERLEQADKISDSECSRAIQKEKERLENNFVDDTDVTRKNSGSDICVTTKQELRHKLDTIVFARLYDVPDKQRQSVVNNLEKLLSDTVKEVEVERDMWKRRAQKWLKALEEDVNDTVKLEVNKVLDELKAGRTSCKVNEHSKKWGHDAVPLSAIEQARKKYQ